MGRTRTDSRRRAESIDGRDRGRVTSPYHPSRVGIEYLKRVQGARGVAPPRDVELFVDDCGRGGGARRRRGRPLRPRIRGGIEYPDRIQDIDSVESADQ